MLLLRSVYPLFWLTAHVVLGAVQFQHLNDLPEGGYDFVVIGGGTAGGVVATRLGENPDFKILVIEAGTSNEDVFATHPPAIAHSLAGTLADWNYTTSPQAGLNGARCIYPRGHVLGGSSSINDAVYTRGSRDDYNRWAAVTEDQSLSWDKMMPYILKNERWTEDSEHQDEQGHFDPSIHGKNGNIAVSAGYSVHPFNDLVFNASRQLSNEFPFKLDMNDGRPIGIGWGQATVDKGVRSSSATGYLATTKNNVHILLNTLVTRVLNVNGDKTDFRGLEFVETSGATRRRVTAKKEVILAGGIINTPQILINSGIGNKAELEPLGIKTLVDNPSVGKNLSDQPAVLISFATNIPVTDFNLTTALAEWSQSHTGPLSRRGGLSPMGMVRLPDGMGGFVDPSAGKTSPHIEFFFLGVSSQSLIPPGVRLPALAKRGEPAVGTEPNVTLQMFISNVNPVSRGSISLTSTDPSTPPTIDFQLLSNPTDLASLIPPGVRLPALAKRGEPAVGTEPNVTLQMFISNVNPVSRGSISLTSTDPFTPPTIDFQLLNNPTDLAVLREGIRSARRFFSAPAWRNKIFGTAQPAANVTTDSQLDEFIRGNALAFFHGVGSAAMSPEGAKWGVVDPDYYVKGTKGLRIVDASIIPYVTAGHTQVPVYALAERASDIIRQKWK
ncbi:Glucose dehydrogenase [FAD, quinone] [Leucoagaricus sp. SymC.cos]|nr:Glucose dehydrogenase [FAD, quinone] [Leucoagaricus sp. SymC.cos]